MSNNNEDKSKIENFEEVDVSIENIDEEVKVNIDDTIQEHDGKKLQKRKTDELSIDQLKLEISQLKKSLERMKLENEANLRNQEKQLTKQIDLRNLSGEIRFYSKFLDIMDNFKRAFTNNNNELNIEGFKLIYDQMKQILESEGIKKIQSVGKQFDPIKHEAIAIIESTEHPNGTVIEEIQSCFTKGDGKILRAAKVIVSKFPVEEKKKTKDNKQDESKDSDKDNNNDKKED